MNIDESKDRLEDILKNRAGAYILDDLSEADTRSKLIDAVLVESLGWHEYAIEREPHVSDPHGFVDYVLLISRPAFVLEAKKHGIQFKLPSVKKQRSFKIGGVLSEDATLKEALLQCKAYGVSKGTSFCCVSNGTQYIFFRSHSDLGLKFEDHQAVVFDGVDDLLNNFGLFYSLLGFDSVSEGHHYAALPVAEAVDNTARFKQLSAQSHRTHYKHRNRLEPFIRDIVTEVFQDLADEGADIELIEQCYVESPSQGSYEQSLRGLVRNRPTLAEGRIKPLRVSRRSAGEFDAVVKTSDGTKQRPSEVVMVIGGIGAGKTTFISRFRKVIAREKIEQHCVWLNINFNKYSDAPGELEKWVSGEIYSEAEKNYPGLDFGSYSHLKQAYHVEYERLKRGRLAPLFDSDQAAFELRFAEELKDFEETSIAHVIKLLRSVQAQKSKRVFLVFDNADQFGAQIQNDVFMLANRMATEVGCSLIVSLREESYWKNKDFGALSAFHGFSYYVEVPDLKQVIAKRFKYASELLSEQDGYVVPSSGLGVTEQEGISIFESIRNTVLGDPRFIKFLEALSPGEVRRPLDQLARFLFSGHTNIDSILGALRTNSHLRLGFHEFLKAVALGDRETFSEEKSDLVNFFALDGSIDASNLNRLAILGLIHSFRKDKSEHGLGYVSFEKVVDTCAGFGVTGDTVQAVIQFLNARRLLETNHQARESIAATLFVRTTAAFDYYLESLASEFVYIDIVLPGTLVPHGDYFDMIERMSSQIYTTGRNGLTRIERIEMRIERARRFALLIADEASRHAMFRADGVVHETVKGLVAGLDASLERQAELILRDAKQAFSSARHRAIRGR
ncbi:hypothetical protein [Thermomonas sp.]|uniref:hypothetical protein n=1 Tax=Thermomonas sp. TaxID=1971895 RepID=UPI003784ED3C